MLDEVAQQLELAGRQLDRPAGLGHFGFAEVDRDFAKPKRLTNSGGRNRRSTPTQESLDAGQQFRHLERLDEIVVGAKLQAHNAIDDLPTGREHEDWGLHSALTKRP